MLRNMLQALGLGGKPAKPARSSLSLPEFPPRRPETELAVVGDVHGMIHLFEPLLARIVQDHPQAQIICVGDLIDRGDASRAVLQTAFDHRDALRVVMGNHEEMMIAFLDDPDQAGPRWLRNGGLQTLASFGIAPPGTAATRDEYLAIRDRLRAAVGDDMESWLRGLPRYFLSGNIAITHAGADPWLPVTQQPEENLTWGHPDCGRRRRTDGTWIVHGHVIVPTPQVVDGVIAIDTGAFAGGRLTCAHIAGDHLRFIEQHA